MKPASLAAENGYSQILWTYGPDEHVTEVGSMNFFVVLDRTANEPKKELITAPLSRGDILPGVTRSSVLELARSHNKGDDMDVTVTERFLSMKEIAENGRLLEAFGTGTAAIVSPVS